jgi:hypothetical protein
MRLSRSNYGTEGKALLSRRWPTFHSLSARNPEQGGRVTRLSQSGTECSILAFFAHDAACSLVSRIDDG